MKRVLSMLFGLALLAAAGRADCYPGTYFQPLYDEIYCAEYPWGYTCEWETVGICLRYKEDLDGATRPAPSLPGRDPDIWLRRREQIV